MATYPQYRDYGQTLKGLAEMQQTGAKYASIMGAIIKHRDNMAQEDILEIIRRNPGIDGNGIKKKLGVRWGITPQVNRLRDKGLVNKEPGETKLTYKYYAINIGDMKHNARPTKRKSKTSH